MKIEKRNLGLVAGALSLDALLGEAVLEADEKGDAGRKALLLGDIEDGWSRSVDLLGASEWLSEFKLDAGPFEGLATKLTAPDWSNIFSLTDGDRQIDLSAQPVELPSAWDEVFAPAANRVLTTGLDLRGARDHVARHLDEAFNALGPDPKLRRVVLEGASYSLAQLALECMRPSENGLEDWQLDHRMRTIAEDAVRRALLTCETMGVVGTLYATWYGLLKMCVGFVHGREVELSLRRTRYRTLLSVFSPLLAFVGIVAAM